MEEKEKIIILINQLYKLVKRVLPPYAHRRGRHRYTFAELVACLGLKIYFNFTYRRIKELILITGEIRRLVRLKRVPNYSTLCRAMGGVVVIHYPDWWVYGQRRKAETFPSVIKRLFGEEIRSRTEQKNDIESLLKFVVCNFYRYSMLVIVFIQEPKVEWLIIGILLCKSIIMFFRSCNKAIFLFFLLT